jgi:hypothetical protein
VVYHDCGVLDYVSRFASLGQVLVVPFGDRPGSGEGSPQEGVSLRRPAALHQLPSEAKGHAPPTTRAPVPQTELLLRSRRLQEEGDAALGTLPRTKGLSGRHWDRSETRVLPHSR